jgi:hypothetical protein
MNIGTANAGLITIGRTTQTVAHPGNVTVAGTIVGGGNISTTLGGITITGNSTIAGTLTSLTGLTSSGAIQFSGLGQGVVLSGATGILSSVNGTTGQVLTATTGAAPTWTTLSASNVVTILANQTYNVPAGTKALYIECVGGGAGGGGAATAAAGGGISSLGSGGGGGAYSGVYVGSPAASYVVTIGAGGAGGLAGNNPGASGGQTSVGAVCVAFGGGQFGGAFGGGLGGGLATNANLTVAGVAGAPGLSGTGDLKLDGGDGGPSLRLAAGLVGISGYGGHTPWAGETRGAVASGAGQAGNQYGGGGAGGVALNTAAAAAGGAGFAGAVRITEYR